MDLKSIINNEGSDSQRQTKTPATPVQPGPSPSLNRQDSQTSLPLLQHQSSHDYSAQTPGHLFTSPTLQQRYAAPPPLPHQNSDLKSPAPSSFSAQSPYRQTPSSAIAGSQYPFPTHPTSQSPAQPQGYGSALPSRESYPPYDLHAQHQQQQRDLSNIQQSPVPITPNVAGGNQSFPSLQHQRSQSTHSNSTPTSAQSQSHYPPHSLHESPLLNSAYPPQFQRQQSHPSTPLGPPLSLNRQSTGSYSVQQSPHTLPQELRPPQPGYYKQPSPSPSAQAAPSPGSYYRRMSISEQQPRQSIHSNREQSMSVSPKTTVSSLHRNSTVSQVSHHNYSEPPEVMAQSQAPKRKFDERQSSQPAQPNGAPQPRSSPSVSSQPPPKKLRRIDDKPIWARSWKEYKRMHNGMPPTKTVNGALPNSTHGARPVHPASAQASKATPPVPKPRSTPTMAPTPAPIATPPVPPPAGDEVLGAWEPCVVDPPPVNDVTKAVADFLYLNVIDRPDWGELKAHGVEVEIEAKLGCLIDRTKSSDSRYFLPVQSEAVLQPGAPVQFKSSMQEHEHQAMNTFLNSLVATTRASNRSRPGSRIPIAYKHRRERDTFFLLPPHLVTTLPPCMLQDRRRKEHKMRVTHDAQTGQVLAKIIKARVADLEIYCPMAPVDVRISVNLEMKCEVDERMEGLERGEGRGKDRMSYAQGPYTVDLTQVLVGEGPDARKEHELEIELDTAAVMEQGRRLRTGEPHKYDKLVEGLLNNIHVLTKELGNLEMRR